MPYAKHNLSAFKEYRDLLAEIERLRLWIRRIDNINDNPARFSKEIDEACIDALAGKPMTGLITVEQLPPKEPPKKIRFFRNTRGIWPIQDEQNVLSSAPKTDKDAPKSRDWICSQCGEWHSDH